MKTENLENLKMEMLRNLESTSNISTCQGHHEEPEISPINEIWFWTSTAVLTLVVIVGILSNSLVLYFANTKRNRGTMRHLNTVVKHLAVSDLLYGVLACPCMCVWWKMGKI